MRLRILLVNPWTCGFAAPGLRSCPADVLMVAEFLRGYDTELIFADFDYQHRESFDGSGCPREDTGSPPCAVPENCGVNSMSVAVSGGISNPDWAIGRAACSALQKRAVDIVLVTSPISCGYPAVRHAVEAVRECCTGAPVILCGSYATHWTEHAAAFSGADFIYSGEVGEQLRFALQTFGFRLMRKHARQKK
jgi:hypothetical protein